ncbi:MAG: hypothetical protein Q7S01_06160 [bacterium]|nr:hypothetical protein [bacterium]
MTKAIAEKLTKAAKAIEVLPEETQNALLAELEERIADFSTPHMSGIQRAEVKHRLSLPRRYVPVARIRSILAKYESAR